MSLDIMLDLETLGLKPGGKILSIGACTFLTDTPDQFYQPVDRNNQSILTEDPNIVKWWTNAQNYSQFIALTTDIRKLNLFDSLGRFDSWVKSLKGYDYKTTRVWGNAASFDLKILEKAYEVFDFAPPWSYKNEMCYRTLKNLFPKCPVPDNPNAHHALSDALVQANHAESLIIQAGLL